jgi:hypothetical protein
MCPISTPKRRHSGRNSVNKPDSKGGAKPKLIRLDPSDLRLIERAARKLDPRLGSSYFIVSAAVERAKAVLAASPTAPGR